MNYLAPNNVQSSTSQYLLNTWKNRYVATVQTIATNPTNSRKYPLEFVASQAGRKRTLEKLPDKLIKSACHNAAARTKRLYLDHQYLKFNDTVDLSKFTLKTIPVLLNCYQQQAPLVINPDNGAADNASELQFGISDVSTLANHLGNCFTEFEAQHSTSKDWLVQCFLTSQISLASTSLLAALDPVEQTMLGPYFNLLEEYVSIPWWRLCLSADRFDRLSPHYKLVEKLLARTSEISLTVYRRWSQQFDIYSSTRGTLSDLKIRRSSLRDFDMFQVYLWLSLLQGNLNVIETELVPFCTYIYKGIGIPWQMTVAGTQLLLEEILMRLRADEKAIAVNYIQGMMQAFQAAA
ncbi:MAG: hypothetical protein AAF821_14855 [Cyanobacteria bacterium P01_D01_bin.156]